MSMDSLSLLNLIESICRDDLNEKQIRNQIEFYNNIMRELKRYTSEADSFYKELASKEYVKDLTLQKKFLFIESVIEKASAEQYLVLAKNSVLEEKIIRHTPMIEKDGSCLGLTSDSQALLVGSGALPITGIILCKKYRCRIVCLDSDPEAIELSKKLISTMGLESYFSFLCIDIRAVDIKRREDTAVIIVAFLTHKDEIIRNYLQNGFNLSLLIRQPRGPYSLIYDKVDIRLINQLKNIQTDTDLRRGHYSSIIGRIE